MKNFKLLWTKKVKTSLGNKAIIRCYVHLPTNNLIYEHVMQWNNGTGEKTWHRWTDAIDSSDNLPLSTGKLQYWVHFFFKHPITLGK